MRLDSSTENLGWAVKMPIIHMYSRLAYNITKSILQYHLYIYLQQTAVQQFSAAGGDHLFYI